MNAISAGPIRTLASSLASGITGLVIYVDAGYCIMGDVSTCLG